jgi:hypothetical protein
MAAQKVWCLFRVGVGVLALLLGLGTAQAWTIADTYNFNGPTTAGSDGQVLASGGGGSAPMTWINVMTNPMTTQGDTLYGGASGAPTRLAGAIGVYYNAAGTAPSWADAATVKTFLGDIALGTGTTGNYVVDVQAGAGLKKTTVLGETQDVDLSVDSTKAGFLTAGDLGAACGAGTAGKMSVHTTPLQYCDNAATPARQYAAYGNALGAATALATTVTSLSSVTSVNGTTIPNAVTLTKTTDKLSVFAATTSLELAGVLSDESGTSGGFQRNPMTNAGDLTYGGPSPGGIPTRLAGAVGLLYNAAGTAPSWADAATVKTFLGVSAPGGTADSQAQYRSSATALGGSSGLTLNATDILSGRMRTTTETTTTLAATDGPVVKCDTSGGDVTLTLPAANSGLGYWFVINTGAVNQCFVRRGETDTINGATGDIEAATQWSTIELRTDGTSDWHANRGKTVVEIADIPDGLITPAKQSATATRRICAMQVGTDNAAAVLVNADIGPQNDWCLVPAAATIREVVVKADDGTPSALPRKTVVAGTHTSLLSGALATAASGARACSRAAAETSFDGATSCTNTLTTTALAAGDSLGLTSGVAGGVAKRMTIWVVYELN